MWLQELKEIQRKSKIGGVSAPLGVKGQVGEFGALAFWLHLFCRKKVVKKGKTKNGYSFLNLKPLSPTLSPRERETKSNLPFVISYIST
jgi:hypothetical protein